MSRKTNRRHTLTALELRAKSGRKRRAIENRRRRLALGFVNRHEDRANEPIHRKEVQAMRRRDAIDAAKREGEIVREQKETRSRAAKGAR